MIRDNDGNRFFQVFSEQKKTPKLSFHTQQKQTNEKKTREKKSIKYIRLDDHILKELTETIDADIVSKIKEVNEIINKTNRSNGTKKIQKKPCKLN